MKNFHLTIFILAWSIGLHAQDSIPKASMFLNLGQSIPIGSYSSSYGSNPLEIGKASPFAKSFNCGIDYFFKNKLGISLGISSSKFYLDKVAFEQSHTDNLNFSDSYLREHFSFRMYTGISTRVIYKRLSIDPRLNIGLTAFNFEYSDFYETNIDGDVVKTINYKYEAPIFTSLNGGINATYELLNNRDLGCAIQIFSEISYQRPRVKYKKNESDKNSGTINKTNESYRQNIMFIYYGIGLVLKIYPMHNTLYIKQP